MVRVSSLLLLACAFVAVIELTSGNEVDAGKCRSWCARKKSRSWASKCRSRSCSGCSQCATKPAPPPPPEAKKKKTAPPTPSPENNQAKENLISNMDAATDYAHTAFANACSGSKATWIASSKIGKTGAVHFYPKTSSRVEYSSSGSQSVGGKSYNTCGAKSCPVPSTFSVMVMKKGDQPGKYASTAQHGTGGCKDCLNNDIAEVFDETRGWKLSSQCSAMATYTSSKVQVSNEYVVQLRAIKFAVCKGSTQKPSGKRFTLGDCAVRKEIVTCYICPASKPNNCKTSCLDFATKENASSESRAIVAAVMARP